jgi:hypothetical protein
MSCNKFTSSYIGSNIHCNKKSGFPGTVSKKLYLEKKEERDMYLRQRDPNKSELQCSPNS